MTTLSLRGVTVGYRRGLRPPPVLRGIDLEVRGGESVLVTGPALAGKTTLLRVLAGVLRPWRGRRVVGGSPAGLPSPVALVDDTVRLPSVGTLARYLRYGAFLAGLGGQRAEAAVTTVAGETDLLRHLRDPLGSLSPGAIHRAHVAFALLARPSALLLDDLDRLGPSSRQVIDVICRREAARGTLVVRASLEGSAAVRHATRTVRIEGGRLTPEPTREGTLRQAS
jgi:ABC-type multidrug transport system ATPase subunit